ncbi:nitrilase-related carbon-nitrogen hydrolase [Thermophilibacter sp.]
MRIGIAQMRTRAGDFEATARRMAEQSRRAAEQGVDLLVFPAAALCGVTPVPSPDREGFLLDVASALSGLVDELACACLVPVLTDVDGVSAPDALLLSDGDITPVGLAARLGSPDRAGGEGSGALPELEVAGARLGVAFTYEDLDEYDDYDYDVDVIVFLSGYGFATDDPSSALGSSLGEGRFPADAEATGAWIVGVGSLGCYDAQLFCGSSFVLAPWGELAAAAPALEEALLVCDVDPSAEGPLEAPLTPEVYDAPLMTWEALVMGLAESAGDAGACALVDGSDLASLLALTLCVDALGPLRVTALVPQGSDAAAERAALELAAALRLPPDAVARVDVSTALDAASARDLALARLAGLARETGRAAVGSLDKTGLALEPAGALRVDAIEPLADLYRSDLVALARMRNTISPVIARAALSSVRVPDLGAPLADLPSDETRLEFVDLVLSGYLEWELPLSDIVSERGHAELVSAVVARLRELEPARTDPVRALTVSSRTLAEARGPRGLAWRDHPRADAERLAARLAELVGAAGETEPAAPDAPVPSRASHERDVRDLLGYLRDFSLGGGFSSLGGSAPGPGRHQGQAPDAPGLWDGPFSEN